MKKVIFTITIALLFFSGCSHSSPEHSKYTFYYIQQDYLYSLDRSVLASEKRTVNGNKTAILECYLKGPKSDSLFSPFPEETSLQSFIVENNCLSIDLGDSFAALSEIKLTLACTALAQTCFDIYNVDTVKILAGNSLLEGQSQIILKKDSVLLYDNYVEEETT